MMLFFSLELGWLPTSGANHGFKSIIMPAVCTAISYAAMVSRMTRSAML